MRVLTHAPAGVLLALSACAGAPPPARQGRLDAAFARIQVAEAQIAHARADVSRAGAHGAEQTPTRDRCVAVAQARRDAFHASRRVCAIAREIADADALARCEQADRDYRSVEQQAARRCPSSTADLEPTARLSVHVPEASSR